MQIDKRRLQTIKRTLKHALAAIILVLSFAAPVAAGPFEDAAAAYRRADYATALRLLRPLADQGDADAQTGLGIIYAEGHAAVPQDYAEALKWYRLAADQGHAFAQHNLGVMYAKGEGVPQNYAEAAKWSRKAADQSDAFAQSNLGVMYANGQGVPKDYVSAYMWLNLAATTDAKAGELRDEVAQHMTPAQIAEAQKLAREWKPTTQTPQ